MDTPPVRPWFKTAVTSAIAHGFKTMLTEDLFPYERYCQVYPLLTIKPSDLAKFELSEGSKLKLISDGEWMVRAIFDGEAIRHFLVEYDMEEGVDLWEFGLVYVRLLKCCYIATNDMNDQGEFIMQVLGFRLMKFCPQTQARLQSCPCLHQDEDIRVLLKVFAKHGDEVERKRTGALEELHKTQNGMDFITISDEQKGLLAVHGAAPEEVQELPVVGNFEEFTQNCVERLATLVFSREVTQLQTQ